MSRLNGLLLGFLTAAACQAANPAFMAQMAPADAGGASGGAGGEMADAGNPLPAQGGAGGGKADALAPAKADAAPEAGVPDAALDVRVPDAALDARVPDAALDASLDTAPAPMDVASAVMDVAPSRDTAADLPSVLDDSRYNFELDEQGWVDLRDRSATGIRRSTTRAFQGRSSLEISLSLAPGGARFVGVSGADLVNPGTEVRVRVWLPLSNKLIYVQPFLLYFPNATENSVWHGEPTYARDIPGGAWHTLVTRAPSMLHRVVEVGVQFKSADGWTGKVYVDSVDW